MESIFEVMMAGREKLELGKVLECNQKTENFGLALSAEEAEMLLASRKSSLRENGRVEFKGGILPELIAAFCDSQFMEQEHYAETLSELQDMFYYYKNETLGELTDDELLQFMRRQFDEICYGDLEYLKNTCAERFSRAVRSGYKCKAQKRPKDEYALREPDNEYGVFSEETQWDFDLYTTSLEDLE